MSVLKRIIPVILISIAFASLSQAQGTNQRSQVYIDEKGIIRWTDTQQEVALFGANYCLPSACDYRAAKYFTEDLKAEIRKDMQHFARMGWDGLRVCFWGDFQNSDSLGNMVNNEHLDLMDYLICEASARGIKMLFSPIVTYSSQWPDAMNIPVHGFSTYFRKSELGTDPEAIKAQQNYLRQILNHVNPYTGHAIKDEENILFIEMINEPWHHSDNPESSVRYVNALVDAVRSTGCDKLLFHNISQDFNISRALKESEIQGVSFAWYPTGLVSGKTLSGNYLPVVDHYGPMNNPDIRSMPRIVYEFDTPDLLSPVMYPAMVRTFRSVGAQFATMFAYDMLVTAKANLGWQTHFLNLVYTPQKAAGAIIAARAMHSLPLYGTYGNYPDNRSFGPVSVSYEQDLSEYVTDETFIYSGTTGTIPANPGKLNQIVGFHSSPLVQYTGEGLYFFDKIKQGIWRLEVYPDAVIVKDPFGQISPDKTVARLLYKKHTMEVNLPDLGADFSVIPFQDQDSRISAEENRFSVAPGVYTLINSQVMDLLLPDSVNSSGYGEFIVPPEEDVPLEIVHKTYPVYQAGQNIDLAAKIVDDADIDSVSLFIRSRGSWFREIPMSETSAYTYHVTIPSQFLSDSYYEYCITVYQGDERTTFPSVLNKSPTDWDFYAEEFWPLEIVNENMTFPVFSPVSDLELLDFTRIGDNIRHGIYSLEHGFGADESALRLSLPVNYDQTLEDYTASLYIGDRIKNLKDPQKMKYVFVNARGLNKGNKIYITLVESEGVSWSYAVSLDEKWKEYKIPIDSLSRSKSAMLPQGFPGNWNYWLFTEDRKNGEEDGLKVNKVERLQISIRNGAESDAVLGAEISTIGFKHENK